MNKKLETKTEKTYSFSSNHDPGVPADCWFQNPPEGLTLFLVFYTRACRWRKCLGCNLPSLASQFPVDFKNIMKQVDYVFGKLLSEARKHDLRKIILSNNGSVLDQETFSTTALMYFIAQMNIHCPNISTLTLETRSEYVDIHELEVFSRALREGQTPTDLEIAIGFEAFDDRIRNEQYRKGLDLDTFENMAGLLAIYNFKLKVYFMLKPVPELTEEQAVNDVIMGINYLNDISEKYELDINLHLNPTYVAYGTPLERAFLEGKYAPPFLESVRRVVLEAEGKRISLFVGLNDEGLAVKNGAFIRDGDEMLIQKLELFNKTQDFNILKQ
jgi:radical SAM enzyme (TIGR01210 family)